MKQQNSSRARVRTQAPECSKRVGLPGAAAGRASLKMRPAAAPACPPPLQQLFVLIACEESQAECTAFRALGHIAYSCDLQKARLNPDWHILGDVTPLLEGATSFVTESGLHVSVPRWDLIIAHPPCTYLCRMSGCQLRSHNRFNWQRYKFLLLGRRFFLKCLDAPADYVAVENPVPLKKAMLPKPTAYASPHWFGVKYTKKTCYWLKNLPPLMPTLFNTKTKCYVKSSRGKYRSRTFPKMAEQIARQWSDFILRERLPR